MEHVLALWHSHQTSSAVQPIAFVVFAVEVDLTLKLGAQKVQETIRNDNGCFFRNDFLCEKLSISYMKI